MLKPQDYFSLTINLSLFCTERLNVAVNGKYDKYVLCGNGQDSFKKSVCYLCICRKK